MKDCFGFVVVDEVGLDNVIGLKLLVVDVLIDDVLCVDSCDELVIVLCVFDCVLM